VQPLVAPPGRIVLTTDALVNDSGEPDVVVPSAPQVPVERLPESTLVFLLGSRYCETDQLSEIAWQRFGTGPTGWARVQAICDFVHHHIEFGYQHAAGPVRPGRPTTKAAACAATMRTWRSRCAAA
jgi:transglutaminase-like putative cysteine protease